MSMNYRIFDTAADALSATARTIIQRVEGGARTIALSGGSTPKPLYASLGAVPSRDELAQFPITWIVVDERCVPIEHPDSNAGMMERTLFANGIAPSHRFLRFRTELNDPAAIARAFEDDWRALGIASLDLVLLGMGDDGHTASLFPGTPVLDVENRIAAEVYVPRLDSWRVTLTKPILRAAALRLVLAPGAKKKPVFEALNEGADYPIAQVTSGVETWWLIDQDAAPLTEKPK
ncbi:MAG: 6-phosphogluconolactonase [Thermoanaerobaculia bacterium]|nr:6-phosphogluconolactonase [Thermoanaerobaculia bacterium]